MRNRRLCSNKEIRNIAHDYVTSDITIRELSAKYEISRSTVHIYLQQTLREIDLDLAEEVAQVADKKRNEGRRRGGHNAQEKIKKEKMKKWK